MTKDEITTAIEGDFAKMERELAAHNPGVNEVLRVFGDTRTAVDRFDACIRTTAASNPIIQTTDATTIPSDR